MELTIKDGEYFLYWFKEVADLIYKS